MQDWKNSRTSSLNDDRVKKKNKKKNLGFHIGYIPTLLDQITVTIK